MRTGIGKSSQIKAVSRSPRTRSTSAACIAVALLLAACSGSESAFTDKLTGADSRVEFIDPEVPTVARSIELADRLVTQLGNDDAAADALLKAFVNGYSTTQVVRAVELDSLSVDGTVPGSEPDGPRLDIGDRRPEGLIRAEQDQSDDRTPIERMRDAAHALGGDNDGNVGNLATVLILWLAAEGLSAEEIIEVLVLGEVEFTRNGNCYRKYIDRFPERCEAVSNTAPQPNGDAAADSTAPSGQLVPEGGTDVAESTPAGDPVGDGTWTGVFDYDGFFDAQAANGNAEDVAIARAVAASGDVLVTVDDSEIVVAGTSKSSNPRIELASGGVICEQTSNGTFDGRAVGFPMTGSGIQMTLAFSSSTLEICATDGSDTNNYNDTFDVPATLTIDGATGTLELDFGGPIPLIAELTRN